MNKLLLLVIGIGILGGAYFFLNRSSSPSPIPDLNKSQKQEMTTISFENPKKSAHYESNTPEHGATLAGVPINVVIDFNFDLAAPSKIKIEKDGKEYGIGNTLIENNKLSMRRNVDPTAPDGIYTVNYKACWPDGSCHDGHFQFAIGRISESSYEDLTGEKEVTINMSNIKFMPMNIKISKGTKVMWINNDEVEHYVNTDPHPAHTYYPDQNSEALKKGDLYSVTFTTPGIYPYHCSAHADRMIGSILVQ